MFSGFSEQTVDFLWGLRFNNNKEWFNAHKQEYQTHLLLPFRALANEVFDALNEKYPELSLSLHVSRIYRDARRLFGRGPMKDYLWFSIFSGKSAEGEIPSFFFGIDPEGYSYGMDYWGNTADVMTRYRRAILSNPAPMLKLVQDFSKQEQFRLSGPVYARSKGAVDPLLQSWFDRRHLTLIHEREHNEAGFRPELEQDMIDGFNRLIPFYRYLLTVVRQAQS